jgi:hypothetical protein
LSGEPFGKDRSIGTVALVGIRFILPSLQFRYFLTGEGAEEPCKKFTRCFKNLIESHEESADIAFWLVEALGALSLVLLLSKRFQLNFAKPIANSDFITFNYCIRIQLSTPVISEERFIILKSIPKTPMACRTEQEGEHEDTN